MSRNRSCLEGWTEWLVHHGHRFMFFPHFLCTSLTRSRAGGDACAGHLSQEGGEREGRASVRPAQRRRFQWLCAERHRSVDPCRGFSHARLATLLYRAAHAPGGFESQPSCFQLRTLEPAKLCNSAPGFHRKNPHRAKNVVRVSLLQPIRANRATSRMIQRTMNPPGARDLGRTLELYSARLPEIHSQAQCGAALNDARQAFKRANDALSRMCRRVQLDGRYDPSKLTLALCRFRRSRRALWLLEGAVTALAAL